MAAPLPKFDAPPVVETILGVQFNRLPKFSTALAGWFWKSKLPPAWNKIQEAPPLEDQFERFGSEQVWARIGMIALQLAMPGESNRVQIIREDGRMIQLQSSRFLYNWRQEKFGYPSYANLLPEFQNSFRIFREFAAEADLGLPQENQWEVTYVSHIPVNGLWQKPGDWAKVFPGFHFPDGADDLEGFTGEWRKVLPSEQGRLHITLRSGRESPTGKDLLILQMTARGPINSARGLTLDNGLDLGHEVIVRTFASITSAEAQLYWKRRA